MKYVENKSEFDSLVENGVLVVDFYADWCGPCRMLSPTIEELASMYEGKVNVVKLNVDKVEEIAARYNIMSIPTVIIFKDGKEVNRMVGLRSKVDYQSAIESL